ncbi:hypothetical protein [Macrococcus capreoli]|uniref:hypothetical protein n=1 Tax=Macrococcus capreoli TaxID=2982690 RepID=UPI003EE7829B
MENFGTIWFVAYYLLIIWLLLTVVFVIKRVLDNMRMRTKSKLELEALQRIELQKRIELLEKELAEKEKTSL